MDWQASGLLGEALAPGKALVLGNALGFLIHYDWAKSIFEQVR